MVTRTNGSDKIKTIGLIMALTAVKIKPASKNDATVVAVLMVVNDSGANSWTQIHKPTEQTIHRMMNERDISTDAIVPFLDSYLNLAEFFIAVNYSSLDLLFCGW